MLSTELCLQVARLLLRSLYCPPAPEPLDLGLQTIAQPRGPQNATAHCWKGNDSGLSSLQSEALLSYGMLVQGHVQFVCKVTLPGGFYSKRAGDKPCDNWSSDTVNVHLMKQHPQDPSGTQNSVHSWVVAKSAMTQSQGQRGSGPLPGSRCDKGSRNHGLQSLMSFSSMATAQRSGATEHRHTLESSQWKDFLIACISPVPLGL